MPNPRQMTNYPGGFANGLSVRGLPLLQSQPGSVYWVSNSRVVPPGCIGGSDNNPGTFQKPFRTLAAALAQCQQGAGDIIFIKPGHSETISSATALPLNVANVAILGIGSGNRRPTFTFDTATTATMELRATGMALQNIRFVANFADIASFVTAATVPTATTSTITPAASAPGGVPTLNVVAVGAGTFFPGLTLSGTGVTANTIILRQLTGTTGGVGTYEVSIDQTVSSTTITGSMPDFALEGCEFIDGSSVLNALTVFTANATANCCNGFYFCRNRVKSLGTTAATTAIKTTVSQDRWTVCQNFGVSAVLNDTAAMLAAGAGQLTMFEFGENVWERPSTSTTGGGIVSGSGNAWTGMAYDNRFYTADGSAAIWISTGHGTAFGYNQNFCPITTAADVSGLINPAAA
jgi:hypothetical protein